MSKWDLRVTESPTEAGNEVARAVLGATDDAHDNDRGLAVLVASALAQLIRQVSLTNVSGDTRRQVDVASHGTIDHTGLTEFTVQIRAIPAPEVPEVSIAETATATRRIETPTEVDAGISLP